MAPWTEVCRDRTIGRKKSLRVPWGFKASHALFPLTCGLVGVFGSMIQIMMLPVFHTRAEFLGMAWLHMYGIKFTQWPWAAMVGLGLGVSVTFGVAEWWAHPAQWEAWKASNCQASFRDVIWRIIPRLR